MDGRIQGQFERLERQKPPFLALIAPWSQGQLRFRSRPDSWSALEVVDHVLRTERGILGKVRANAARNARAPMADRVRSSLLTLLMKCPVRVKVPAAVPQILPGGDCDLAEMKTTWDLARMEWRDWLEEVNAPRGGGALFRHPVSGWMTLPQTLNFMSAHLRHHEYQLRRIRRDARWLAAGRVE